jgi:hypothetical protein
MKVIAQIINTTKEFKWRLVKGKEHSEWTSHYSGICRHKFKDGKTYCYLTAYWDDGILPIETPFEIIIHK